MEGKLSDVVRSQFLLAQYGISIDESNSLSVFEFDAFLNLAIEIEEKKIEQKNAST
jgi:hypothetical protein